MDKKKIFIGALALAVAVPAVLSAVMTVAQDGTLVPQRPEGPCDVYAAGGAPCAAAHSTTRALLASYDGPLYQIMRASDGKTLDIGVVKPSAGDPGGYADAAAQDAFCAGTTCWISVLYDQSGNGNHLTQAPRGGFSGNSMGGFDNLPMADWAPVTLGGHKVYGVFIVSGTGLRNDDPKGTAVDDQAEGQYWVISGHHYNSRCCFDYGNAEIDSRDDGDGTMETTYFGNAPDWYYGPKPGPWIMTDQENNLVGCVNPDPNDKFCKDLENITWRFVTATADGEPHHWRSMGGDAQGGELGVIYDGPRIDNPNKSYDPMRKQGAILLGNGGDNGNGSTGTFYEGAMTAAGTFPSTETCRKVQENIVAAKYDVQTLSVSASDKTDRPSHVQTFTPKETSYVTVTYTNTSGAPAQGLKLSLDLPAGWKAEAVGAEGPVKFIDYAVAPGQTVVADFQVRSGKKPFNGDLRAKAEWNCEGMAFRETAVEKVRNVEAVKINEYSDNFIELYNASGKPVDISGWTLTNHPVHIPYFSSIRIPKGTVLGPGRFYLLGMSNSALAVDAAKGDKVVYVSNVEGMKAGDEVCIGAEKHRIASVKALEPGEIMSRSFRGLQPRRENLGQPTTIWQPLPDGPVITIPAGSTNIPVTDIDGLREGGKMAIGYGATYPVVNNAKEKYEVVTITHVGKPGTQAYLSMDAKAGDTNIKVSDVTNISVGDKIRLDIESVGHGIETVTVKAVGTASSRATTFGAPLLGPNDDPGTGLELEEPLKFNHSSNLPFSVQGTGIDFEPATRFDHSSNEPVLGLAFAIELEKPLASAHSIDEAVYDAASAAGYHGAVPADQLFGGPVIGNIGNMTLRDSKGNVVETVNYGAIVDPWLSEGYQADSGFGEDKMGNFAPTPVAGSNRGFGAAPVKPIGISAGRYPDGADTDDNKVDFRGAGVAFLTKDVKAGEQTIEIGEVSHLTPGKFLCIDGEYAKVGTVGEVRSIFTEMRWGDMVIKRESRVMDVTLAAPLSADHASGTAAVDNLPTPGMPNRF